MSAPGILPSQQLARGLVRLLDGDHVWGGVHGWCDRRGTRHYRLVVYPPGISRDRRRLVRVWRVLPGLVVAMLAPTLVVGHAAGSIGGAMLVLAAAAVLLGLRLARAASPERGEVREFWAQLAAGAGVANAADRRRRRRLENLLDRLTQAEQAHDAGRLGTAGFLTIWNDVYRELDDQAGTHTGLEEVGPEGLEPPTSSV